MSGFVFGGKASWDYGVCVEYFPKQQIPMRRMTTYQVAGRSGVLHVDEGCYDPIPRAYDIYFRGEKAMPEQAHAVKNWLLNAGVGARLEDTYDPTHFYYATFQGPADMENVWNRAGRCTINFSLDPRAFQKSGEIPVTFTAPGQLRNATDNVAQPMITAYGTSAGTVTIGSTTVDILEFPAPIILDCETMNAYSQPGEGAPVNRNGIVKAKPFPTLAPGLNAVSFSGGIEKIEIIPRWWDL